MKTVQIPAELSSGFSLTYPHLEVPVITKFLRTERSVQSFLSALPAIHEFVHRDLDRIRIEANRRRQTKDPFLRFYKTYMEEIYPIASYLHMFSPCKPTDSIKFNMGNSPLAGGESWDAILSTKMRTLPLEVTRVRSWAALLGDEHLLVHGHGPGGLWEAYKFDNGALGNQVATQEFYLEWRRNGRRCVVTPPHQREKAPTIYGVGKYVLIQGTRADIKKKEVIALIHKALENKTSKKYRAGTILLMSIPELYLPDLDSDLDAICSRAILMLKQCPCFSQLLFYGQRDGAVLLNQESQIYRTAEFRMQIPQHRTMGAHLRTRGLNRDPQGKPSIYKEIFSIKA